MNKVNMIQDARETYHQHTATYKQLELTQWWRTAVWCSRLRRTSRDKSQWISRNVMRYASLIRCTEYKEWLGKSRKHQFIHLYRDMTYPLGGKTVQTDSLANFHNLERLSSKCMQRFEHTRHKSWREIQEKGSHLYIESGNVLTNKSCWLVLSISQGTSTFISAPDDPFILSAIFLRLIPRIRFIFLEWIFTISSRDCSKETNVHRIIKANTTI